MSFLEEINQRKRQLRTCETHVTTPAGAVYREVRQVDGSKLSVPVASFSPGFVVDFKPDLQVADVLPGLLMGSQDVAQDADLLQRLGVTHVLSLGVPVSQFTGITYELVDILDVPDCRLMPLLEPCFLFINTARESGCVFVHCNAGISRSAAIVIGYLIKLGWSYEAAYCHLKKKRNTIKPNVGFVEELKLYEQLLGEHIKDQLTSRYSK